MATSSNNSVILLMALKCLTFLAPEYLSSQFIQRGEISIKRYQGQNSVSNRDRHSVSRTGTACLGQAQRIEDRHSVSRTGTACLGQAHRIADRHIVSRTGTAYLGQAQRV